MISANFSAVKPLRLASPMRGLALPLLWAGALLGTGLVHASDAGSEDAGLVGLRLDAGPRAYLSWQAPLWRPEAAYGDGQARQMRVALALTPQNPFADLRRGLLTQVELSGQTTLALRPRGSRFGLLLTRHG